LALTLRTPRWSGFRRWASLATCSKSKPSRSATMPDMAQPLHTPLCRELGIEYPIFCAGIGTAAGPDLVAAVSNAGGFGVVGASSFLAEAIPPLIARIRERTTRPFGVNFIIDERDSSDEDRAITRQQVSAAIAARVAAVI